MAILDRLLRRGYSRFDDQADQEMKSLEQLEKGDGESSGLLSSDSFIHALEQSGNTVEAERTSKHSHLNLGIEAYVFRAMDLEVSVAENYQAGDVVPVQGPNGVVRLVLPASAVPGAIFRHRVKGEPEYRIEVPRGASSGSALTFARADGVRISLAVPPGLKAGDMFDVTPPAVMVLVPEGLQPGDYVVFNTGSVPGFAMSGEQAEWFRARVPDALQLGRYFAARLPEPEEAQKRTGGKRASLRRFFSGAAV